MAGLPAPFSRRPSLLARTTDSFRPSPCSSRRLTRTGDLPLASRDEAELFVTGLASGFEQIPCPLARPLQHVEHPRQSLAVVRRSFKNLVRQLEAVLVEDNSDDNLRRAVTAFLAFAPPGLGVGRCRSFEMGC